MFHVLENKYVYNNVNIILFIVFFFNIKSMYDEILDNTRNINAQ